MRRIPATLAAALALVLGGCAYAPTLVSSPSGKNLPPAIDQVRFEKIVSDTAAAAKLGDDTHDTSKMAVRFVNPALSMRAGEYAWAGSVKGAKLKAFPLGKPQIMVVGQAGEWPRYLMSVSPVVKGQPLYVYAFVQSQARSNYALWGYVKLFSKAKFPATFVPEMGSPVVGANDAGLAMVPGKVASQYAALLNNPGDKVKDVFDTSLDTFLASFNQKRADYANLARQAPGVAIGVKASVGPDGFVSLGTNDGGALMMASLRYEISMTTPRKMNLSPLARTFTGKTSAQSALTETHAAVVLFYLPPSGKVKVLGATSAPVAMSAN